MCGPWHASRYSLEMSITEPGKPQQILLLRLVLIVSLLVAVVHSQSLTVLTTYYATISKYIGLPLVF